MASFLLTLVLACPLPAPDVLRPGETAVNHQLVLEWDAEEFSQDFFAFPTAGFGGLHRIVQGEPFSFSSKYGTRIYALPPGETFETPEPTGPRPTWPSSSPPVAEISSVRSPTTLTRIETRVRVIGVSEDSLELEVVDEVRDRSPLALLGIGVIGVVLLGVVAWVVRRSRGAQPA